MIDKFLENLSEYPFLYLLSNSKIGLEKEALRVDKYGTISYKMHPLHFGASLTNKFITTDYSEALIEVVTPPCNSHEEAINYLENIIGFVYKISIKNIFGLQACLVLLLVIKVYP